MVLTHTSFQIHTECNQVKAEDMFEAVQSHCQRAFKGTGKHELDSLQVNASISRGCPS